MLGWVSPTSGGQSAPRYVRLQDRSSNKRPKCCNKGKVHVSEHPTQNARASDGHEDHPTTHPPPPPASESPTRAFAGFRTERRFGEAQTRGVPPPETRVEPRAWAATPHKGLPQVVDSPSQTSSGFYRGQPPGPANNTGQRPAVHPSPYPELST